MIIGGLVAVSKNFEIHVRRLDIDDQVDVMQKTAPLLGMTRLLRIILTFECLFCEINDVSQSLICENNLSAPSPKPAHFGTDAITFVAHRL